MKVSQSTRLRAEAARKAYEETGNLSEVGRRLGIHRSTLDRWQKEGLLSEPVEPVKKRSLEETIEKALQVIDDALDGQRVTPAQIRAAIEVTKMSNSLRVQQKAEDAKKSLAELIQEEDEFDSD